MDLTSLSPNLKRLALELSRFRRPTRDQLATRLPWGGSKLGQCLAALRRSGVITAQPAPRNGSGRRPLAYTFRADLGYFLGIHCDIPGDNFIIVDFNGDTVAETSYAADSFAHNAVESFCAHACDFLSGHPAYSDRILAAGISGAVAFNPKGSRSFRRPSYADESIEPIRSALEKRHRFPLYLGRPQVLICYGTDQARLITEKRSFVNVMVTDNVGISLFVEGKSYLGSSGLSGDLGHIKVPGNTEPCYCGSAGCLRTMISYQAICFDARRRIGHILEGGGSAPIDLRVLDGPDFERGVRILVERALAHDPLSTDIICGVGEQLGNVLATVVSLFNPECLFVHSLLSDAGPIFTERVRGIIRKNTLDIYSRPLTTEFAPYEKHAAARGSAVYARGRFIEASLVL